MRRIISPGLNDNPVRPGPARLHVILTDAVITDQRIRHADSLSGIRRIRQHFQISSHRRVEHDLTDDLLLSADVDSTLILEGDMLTVFGQLFGTCKIPADLIETRPVVPAVSMLYYDLTGE